MSEHTEAPTGQPTWKQKLQDSVPAIETAIFGIRWILVPLYAGLVVAEVLYILHFLHEIWAMIYNFIYNFKEQNVLLLAVVELLDMVLISQLVVMTIQGGWAIFIKPFNIDPTILPQWLKHGLGTSEQKIKMGMSIINIMLVQLLQNWLEGKADFTQANLWMREQMLGCAIVATVAFCVINLLMHHPMLNQHDDHKVDNHKPEGDTHHA